MPTTARPTPAVDSVPSTRVQAKAAALFGGHISVPGVHCLPPDREGWIWFLVVSDLGRILALAAVPADLATPETIDTIWQWRGDFPTSAPTLTLVDGSRSRFNHRPRR